MFGHLNYLPRPPPFTLVWTMSKFELYFLEAFPQGSNIMNQVVAKLRLSLALYQFLKLTIFCSNGDNEFNQSAFQNEVW